MDTRAWNDALRAARVDARLSRQAVAARVALSVETIRSYESGRRHPSRSSLHALLDVLGVDPHHRAEIIRGAGFTVEAPLVGEQSARPHLSLRDALDDIETYPWPAHVNSELFEVLGANARMQALWGVDLAALPSAVDRNMLIALTDARWADRIVNWEEAMRMCASMLKGGYAPEVLDPAGPSPYLAAVLDRLLGGRTPYVQRFLELWAHAEPRVHTWRFAFPIVWLDAQGRELRFRASVNPVNFDAYLTVTEWIPVDAATWRALEAGG